MTIDLRVWLDFALAPFSLVAKTVGVICSVCGLLGRPWHPANADGHKKAAEAWAERVSEA